MIRKLIVANRGEIACRIMRTARAMGIATVAVHSDADRDAPHVGMADEAVRIGGAAPAGSYLDGDAIVAAAQRTGADAVHPGYGFLSENAGFAERVREAGLVFVGPPADAIRAMGDKARAKAIMEEAGVPVVPGYAGAAQDTETLAREADCIGFPLLVKASAGGGGRGMRRVASAKDFAAALESARREAENAFGDGTMLLEKLVTEARHIEVQVFADSHGNTIHLGERDCSAQRRHQKVIEETPSPALDASLRAAICADAVRAAGAVGYRGAGTVEFIIGADGAHCFLEMNTRLQVEHPVTEMVTGLDLVEWQLRIAAGEALPCAQEDIVSVGHAVEARLYAEDPDDGFMPQSGRILHWRPDAATARQGIRIDAGIGEGQEVSPHYDPMLAKVIAHGRDRAEALARLEGALRAAPVFGVVTNRGFLLDVLASDAFRGGRMTTGLIEEEMSARPESRDALPEAPGLAAAVLALCEEGDWFRVTGIATCPVTFEAAGGTHEVELRFSRGRLAGVTVDGEPVDMADVAVNLPGVSWSRGGTQERATALVDGRHIWIDMEGRTYRFSEPDLLAVRAAADDPAIVRSPVAGLVRAVAVTEGARVAAGDTVAVVEAMKMETTLVARMAGIVAGVYRQAGEQVAAGETVVRLDPAGGCD